MAPLIFLLVTFLIALFAIKLIRKEYNIALSARIALSVMLVFTAIGHFIYTKGMTMMMPEFMPYKTQLVYGTGILELLAAIGLHLPKMRTATAWLLILFFVLILPANINAALKNVDYQKATFNGKGTSYLWFRIPLQILFIVWTYLSSIQKRPISKEK